MSRRSTQTGIARGRPEKGWPLFAYVRYLVVLLSIVLAAGPAVAGSFEVTPIRVEIVPGQTTTTITLRNLSDDVSSEQVRAFSWTQTGDEDNLTPTQDIVMSPPIFTIPPGQVQTVRVLVRNRDAQPGRPWRLLFDEVPPPVSPVRSLWRCGCPCQC